mmetsp:Transcript_22189/g.47988  ORF Transcript_22189/g.47988 Transcript_22189/m.47988 type:complete len:239 (-) Transcript_22189:404-1120(-)
MTMMMTMMKKKTNCSSPARTALHPTEGKVPPRPRRPPPLLSNPTLDEKNHHHYVNHPHPPSPPPPTIYTPWECTASGTAAAASGHSGSPRIAVPPAVLRPLPSAVPATTLPPECVSRGQTLRRVLGACDLAVPSVGRGLMLLLMLRLMMRLMMRLILLLLVQVFRIFLWLGRIGYPLLLLLILLRQLLLRPSFACLFAAADSSSSSAAAAAAAAVHRLHCRQLDCSYHEKAGTTIRHF